MYESEHGLSQYEANNDSPFSYPLTIAAACALRVVPPRGGIIPPAATEAEIRSWGRVALPDAGNSASATVEEQLALQQAAPAVEACLSADSDLRARPTIGGRRVDKMGRPI